MSFGDGLKNYGGWQWFLLQNHLNPSVPCVDFHSYSVLHAFEKWIQQSMDLFLIAAIEKHLCIVELFSLLFLFYFVKEGQMQCSLATGLM